jgi:O-antigen/teichoic acid export membrane protein
MHGASLRDVRVGSVRKSVFYSLAQNYLLMVLQLATTMVLARILRPDEVGIFSVAASLAALASVVRDFGVAEYLIQEANLTRDKIRAALAINIMVSWTMAALMFGGSFVAGEFYSQAGIGSVMRVLACNFLLIPFGAITMAYFRRQMNFAPNFRITMVAGVASSIAAVALGMSGFSYMSMAYSSLLGVAITVGMTLAMRPPELPRWPGLKEIRGVLAFGGFASGIYVFGQLGRSAPDLIIGRTSGMEDVGFFSRASGLLELFVRTVMSAVHSVALPYFAATRRDGGNVSEGFLKTVLMTTSIGWPFYAVCACLALPVIRVLYGDQWDVTVPLVRILCFAMAIELVLLMSTELLLALSEARKASLLQASMQVLRALIILAAAPFGLSTICYGLVVTSILNAALAFFFLAGSITLLRRDVVRACMPACGITATAILGALSGLFIAEQLTAPYIGQLAAGGLLALAAALATIWLTKHPFANELRLLLTRLPAGASQGRSR